MFSILLLYIYQLPVKFPYVVLAFADFIGLFKVSSKSEWPELSSGISLLVYYFMVSNKASLRSMLFLLYALPCGRIWWIICHLWCDLSSDNSPLVQMDIYIYIYIYSLCMGLDDNRWTLTPPLKLKADQKR